MTDKEKDLMARIEFYKKRINEKYADLEILRKKIVDMQGDISQWEVMVCTFENKLLELHKGEIE